MAHANTVSFKPSACHKCREQARMRSENQCGQVASGRRGQGTTAAHACWTTHMETATIQNPGPIGTIGSARGGVVRKRWLRIQARRAGDLLKTPTNLLKSPTMQHVPHIAYLTQ